MELTEQSLTDAILKLKQMATEREEIIHTKPRYLLFPSHALWFLDRLFNPWKGERAKWLSKKR